MADYITGIETDAGVKQIDYNSLANKPIIPDMAEIHQLDTRVTTLENTPIPEQTIANSVDNYLNTHGGVYASQVDFERLKDKVLDESPNLFDKTSSDLKYGYFSNQFNANSNYAMTHPIRLKGGVTYKYPQSSSLGGNTQVPYYTAEGGEISTAYVSGTLANGYVTIRFGIDVWARINIGGTTSIDTFMICEEDKYPTQYVDYGTVTYSQEMQSSCADYIDGLARYESNPLSGKSIVFDGDSISYGANDSYGGGWGRRIGERNSMQWSNVSETGATIAVVAGRHNLCTYIDTIHSRYPSLDYFIFDGGTNDADRYNEHGDDAIGTFVVDDFSGNYDTTTFSGAFETLLFKAINYYPNAKIGYIVAPKMGVYTPSQSKVVFPRGRKDYFERAKQICEKWGIPYLDLWNGSQINPALNSYYNPSLTPSEREAQGYVYTVDCQHPSAVGYEYITPMINDWIKSL